MGNGPCPHSKGHKSKRSDRTIFGPPCQVCYNAGAWCSMCDQRIERGEAWARIPALGVEHRRRCNPVHKADGKIWTVGMGKLPPLNGWRSLYA
jgi:hypothetical protein